MCITTSPAKLSNTLIYVGEGHTQGKDVHVLAYQNKATNQVSSPNAMVLPFPTNKEMGPDNVIDTREFKGFLKDISNATKHLTRSLGGPMLKSFSLNAAQVFDVGSYTVVLAENTNQIQDALKRVPENKRPTISDEFLAGYGALYPNQPVAVCCWDGTIEAEPLLWWYEPTWKGELFIPTMDAHDGNAPNVRANVKADHMISVGSADNSRVGHHHPVFYKDQLPDNVRELLPNFVYGTQIKQSVQNGDMFVETRKMCAGSKAYKDVPRARRGANSLDAIFEFEMMGWA